MLCSAGTVGQNILIENKKAFTFFLSIGNSVENCQQVIELES